MKSEKYCFRSMKGYRPNMPVQVVGVKNGKITSNRAVEIFKNSRMHRKSIQTLIQKKIPTIYRNVCNKLKADARTI